MSFALQPLPRPGTGGAAAAPAPVAGDITAARVNADGWTLELDILGFKVGGNVNRGRDTNGAYPGSGSVTVGYSLDPYGTPMVALGVTSRSGYDATTGASVSNLTETVLGTISKRKAYSVGGAEQTNDETDNTTYITIRIALDKRVLSGETVTLTALADLYRDNGSGGSSAQSRAVTGLAVTNNSTAAGKKPIVGYLTPPRQLLYQDKDFEFSAAHKQGRSSRMVAAVVMTWTGATSGVIITKTVTAMVLSGFFRTDMPRVCVFKATLTTAEIATFTQGEQVNWTCEARPFVGPAYTCGTDGTAFPTPRTAQSLPFVCDKNNSLRAFATVDPSGALTSASTAGCSSNDTEQTNTANCYSQMNAALTALKTFMGRNESAGAVIYLRAGTYATLGGTNNTTTFTFGTHWVTITHAPSTNRAGAIVTTTAGQSITGNDRRMGAHIHFYDLTMVTLNNATGNDNVLLNGPDSTATPTKAVWVDQCLVTSLSTHATPSACFSGHGQQYFTNNYLTGKVRMTVASGRGFYLIGGNEFDNCGIVNVHGPFVGNYGHAGTQFQQTDPGAANVILPLGMTYSFNKFSGADPVTVGWFTGSVAELTDGVARVQNLTENWNNAVQAAFNVSADGDTTQQVNEVDAYNTAVGERTNYMYNSTGTVAVVKDGVARFNVYYQRFIKRDTFSDPTNGKQAGRIGNWPTSHGVDSYGNVTLASQFGFSAAASNSDIADFWPGGKIVGTVGFTDDKSGSAGAGGGTYTLTGVSNDAYDCVPAGLAMLPYDLAAVARLNDGHGAAGPYERP